MQLLQLLTTTTIWIAGSTAAPLADGASPVKHLIARANPGPPPIEPPPLTPPQSLANADTLSVQSIVRAQTSAVRRLTWWLEDVTFGLIQKDGEQLDSEGQCIDNCMSTRLAYGSGMIDLGQLYDECRAPGDPTGCNIGPESKWKSHQELWDIKRAQIIANNERRRRAQGGGGNNPSRFQFGERIVNGFKNFFKSTGAALNKAQQQQQSGSSSRPVGAPSSPAGFKLPAFRRPL